MNFRVIYADIFSIDFKDKNFARQYRAVHYIFPNCMIISHLNCLVHRLSLWLSILHSICELKIEMYKPN